MRLGDVDLQIDTTISVGVSWLTRGPETQYLPISNGGPADTSVYITPDGMGATASCSETRAYGSFCQEGIAIPNFDGSINTDDGRLNFDQGEAYTGFIRVTPEIEARMGDFTGFARINIWHDAIAMDGSVYNRGGDLSNRGENNVGQDIELLDAYISYDGDAGNSPFSVKLGRQVINWGEATFIPGGNSAFNPIDVAALRRPGAEIKEALLPVEAIYGSIAVTQDLTLEAYYGGWDKYRLDGGGTPHAISDSFTDGLNSGNPRDIYFIGGGGRSGDQFACEGVADLAAAGLTTSAGVINAILAIDGAVNCAESPNIDVLNDWTTGDAEAERWAAGDTNYVTGLEDEDGDAGYGIALRYYAENLNSTEFAFYYQKGDSRLPYVSFRSGLTDVKAYSTGLTASTVGRGVGPAGCAGVYQETATASVTNPLITPAVYYADYDSVAIRDTKGLLMDPGIQAVATGVANFLATTPTFSGYARSATPGLNVGYLTETNCLLALGQAQAAYSLGSAFDPAGQLPTGATNIGIAPEIALFAEFPEVETFGISFNTTFLGWGVQGDFTHRPDVPLQFDTDVLTIASLFNNCAFTGVGAFEAVYLSGSTYSNEFGGIGCSDEDQYLRGYTTEHDAITWDIGTTATFTRSNPLVSLLGSDLGVFLTEFQGVFVDDIEDERGDTGGITALGAAEGITPLTNTCQGGSDLPLNGILSIDDRTAGAANDPNDDNPKGFCRPTDSSWGLVLLFQLQYNNVFGTPIGLKPTLVYNHGIDGFSPGPIGFWREGQGSTAFRLDAEYLGRWKGTLGYTTYHGDLHRTRLLDRDNVSLSVSYAY